jgi:hypothetical protein
LYYAQDYISAGAGALNARTGGKLWSVMGGYLWGITVGFQTGNVYFAGTLDAEKRRTCVLFAYAGDSGMILMRSICLFSSV